MKLNNRQLVDKYMYVADTPPPQLSLHNIWCGEYRFDKCVFYIVY